jgi:hypothetical protein
LSCRRRTRADLRQGLQDRADVYEDGAGAGLQGAHDRREGWFSTNILGNRDGEVLDDPQSFKTKEESKLGSLEYIFQPELYPISTRTSTTRFASTTTRRAATRKKPGTTSTSSAGWATRCRSR